MSNKTVSLVKIAPLQIASLPTFSPEDSANARRWYAESTGTTLGKGRTPRRVLLAWHRAGSPEIAAAPTVVATIEYRALDKRGRVNGKTRHLDVLLENMPNRGQGRPATVDYLTASGITRETGHVSRIVTANGALHSVTWDHENDEYVIRWESKADQRAVIVSLLTTLAAYRNLAEENNLTLPDADTQSEDPTLP